MSSEPTAPRGDERAARRAGAVPRRARRTRLGYELRGHARRRPRPRRRARAPAATGIALPSRAGERRPVIPEHLRTWAGVRGTAARHGALLAHRGAYPRRSARPATCSRRPGGRCTACWSSSSGRRRWWWLRRADPAAVAGRHRRRQPRVAEPAQGRQEHPPGPRPDPVAAAFWPSSLAPRRWWKFAPWWGWAILAAVALPLLARAGRPADKRIIRAGDDDAAVPGASTPTWCCAPTTRPGSATRTSPASRSRSARRCPATATAPGSWSTCRTARAWTTRSRPAPAIASGLDVTPVARCSSTVTRPRTAGTRCGSPTGTRWPCRSAARRCWPARRRTSGSPRRSASTSAASWSPCR